MSVPATRASTEPRAVTASDASSAAVRLEPAVNSLLAVPLAIKS